MNILDLTVHGLCRECETWQEFAQHSNAVPSHTPKAGSTECKGSDYSASKIRYVVKTDDEARRLANWIKNDDGRCLAQSGRHSLACGDGEYCSKERLRLARALVVYYIEREEKREAGAAH